MHTQCAKFVPNPVDFCPNRSPRAVHDVMLKHIAGKEIVEIGTHAGDGLLCFAQVAKRATGIECCRKDCKTLLARADAMNSAGMRGFKVICADYRIAPANLDADIFTWWQHPPHLWNHRILAELRLRQLQGRVRLDAVAIFLADRYFAKDRESWRSFEGRFLWQETVTFDEVALCHGLHNGSLRSAASCARARGAFNVGSMRIADLGWNITADGRGATRWQPPNDGGRPKLMLTPEKPTSLILSAGNVLLRPGEKSQVGMCTAC